MEEAATAGADLLMDVSTSDRICRLDVTLTEESLVMTSEAEERGRRRDALVVEVELACDSPEESFIEESFMAGSAEVDETRGRLLLEVVAAAEESFMAVSVEVEETRACLLLEVVAGAEESFMAVLVEVEETRA